MFLTCEDLGISFENLSFLIGIHAVAYFLIGFVVDASPRRADAYKSLEASRIDYHRVGDSTFEVSASDHHMSCNGYFG